MKKLSSNKGETLVETLFTVLIVSMSVAMLALMTVHAAGISAKADSAQKAIYEDMTEVNLRSMTPAAQELTVVVNGGGNIKFNVNVYTQNQLAMYELDV